MKKNMIPGDFAYWIENDQYIREGKILENKNGICKFFLIEGEIVKVPYASLFIYEEEAQNKLDELVS